MPSKRNTAGGRAAQTGFSFQAHVAGWFASHLAADLPIGDRFGLPSHAKAAGIRCETGDAIDDVVVLARLPCPASNPAQDDAALGPVSATMTDEFK